MKQLLPGHSSSFIPSVCANTHPVLVAEMWIMAVMCNMLAWTWHEISAKTWALCLFFFFLIFLSYFSLWKGWSLTTLMINCGGFIALRWAQGPLCSHKEMCFDLKNEHFIVASVRLTDCCSFLIYRFSVSEIFWLWFINKELLEV